MNKAFTKIVENNKSSTIWLLFLGTSTTTIYFNTKFLDPFNTPKLIVITILGAWLLGHVIDSIRKNSREVFLNDLKILLYPLLFIISMLVSFIFTDIHIVGLIGESTRRNGLLAYISLVIILIFTFQNVNVSYSYRFFKISILSGVILSLYGLLQISGNDFVAWDNPFNSMISTLGNPNFASAMLAIFTLLSIFSLFIKSLHIFYKILAVIVSVNSLYAITKSESRQGLLVLAFGIIFYICVYSYYNYSRLRLVVIPSSIILVFFAVLGMLQKGPFVDLLYKYSVSVRGYYWRAAISMLKEKPFTGVGLDRFGAYFKEFREPEYGLINGFILTSSNAHNTFLQFFATGGLFLGVTYLLLTLFIFKIGISLVNRCEGENRKLILGLFSTWVAFQSQSLISIDNIGISIWGWLLSGVILGIYRNEFLIENITQSTNIRAKNRTVKINLFQPILSSILLIPAILISFHLYQLEHKTYLIRGLVATNSLANKSIATEYSEEIYGNPFADPNYKFQVAGALYSSSISTNGLTEIKKLYSKDNRNLDYLRWLVAYETNANNFGNAITLRESITKYDPWNAENYLQLGLLYKSEGKIEKSQEMLAIIMSFASENEIAKVAQERLA